jgi:hypothetical protein
MRDEERPEGGDEQEESRRHVWNPDAVARALSGVAMQAAHLIRRARWLSWLTEASLAWSRQDGMRLVLLERGRITSSGLLEDGRVPAPPGAGRRPAGRRAGFDLATYDRLRVLTTELKRLAGEEREIHLHLGSRRLLDLAGLKKVLKWV